ncbi:hypothetical protein PSH97_18920 [Pseudomonas cucumis]|uniref:Uncharacterized protein n=1 Tax=Pseudomonas cucumis TaxID=2954082 RepID=A0ABY9ER88_9PSED|nr:hypothetical protein [Pseudomonas cucumis]WLG83177.1 hypothetical protein PSH97_18920 [Pseudomonas cucumis]
MLIAFDDLMLGYILNKLTDVFEEIVAVSKNTFSDKAPGVAEVRQRKIEKKLPVWLQRLKISTPYQVTHVLLDQMHASRKLKRGLRFEAQAALLEALAEAELAMDVANYSAAVLENRLKCLLDR